MYILNIEPKPQSRPRFNTRGGFVQTYEDKEMTAWKKDVRYMFNKGTWYTKDELFFDGETVKFDVTFYVNAPKYLQTKKNADALENETLPVPKKPDIDNYVKALLDSLNGLAFSDDGQVAEIHAVKRYSLKPRIEFEMTEIKSQ